MNIKDMSTVARYVSRTSTLPMFKFSPEEQLAEKYVQLNLELANLASVVKQDKKQICTQYCRVLELFLEIANTKKWTYLLVLTPEDLAKFQQKWAATSFNNFYLIIQEQLNKSYFQRQERALALAWRMVIKFGMVELALNMDEVEQEYYKLFK